MDNKHESMFIIITLHESTKQCYSETTEEWLKLRRVMPNVHEIVSLTLIPCEFAQIKPLAISANFKYKHRL